MNGIEVRRGRVRDRWSNDQRSLVVSLTAETDLDGAAQPAGEPAVWWL